MRKFAAALVFLAIAAVAVFWLLTKPSRLPAEQVAAMETGDPARGERIFWAGGCASCHAEKGAKDEGLKQLGGGLALATPFGTFHAPNISPDPATGIGTWSGADFANAMMTGVSPEGEHYYPAFPYTSYARMQVGDVADLWAYLKTLPAGAAREHRSRAAAAVPAAARAWPVEAAFPFRRCRWLPSHRPTRSRRSASIWSRVRAIAANATRRAISIGGAEKSRWLAGGPAPEGKGRIPNITPGGKDVASWSEGDIVTYLETGFTPEFDSVGGSMVGGAEEHGPAEAGRPRGHRRLSEGNSGRRSSAQRSPRNSKPPGKNAP